MTTKRGIIIETLATLSLSHVQIEDTDALGAEGPTLSESLPTATAKQLVERLQARGIEADWAPDGDDASQAWVYLESRASDLDAPATT